MDGADSAKKYEYDANGNVTKDLNRNILSIQYNSLNLPSMIKFADGKTIKYTYSADGRKLRVVYTTVTPATSKQVDYCGNLIFENGQLKQMLVDGGYIPMDDWSGTYRFYVKDHLGNNREVVNAKGVVQQVTNYYPFGAPYADATAIMGAAVQPYKYNGKELDLMHGLNTYDYGARQHDPILARWDRIDPLSHKYYSTSPYAYCMNNPVKFVDPDGRRWDEYDVNGKKISNLGGNSINFYHQKDNSIIIKNRANGITNTMKDDMISGYTHRSNSTSWFQITHEFISEYGPTKSLFSDFSGSGEGPFKSLESSSSTYLGKAIDDIMENNAEKNLIKVTTSDANPISAGTDMWEQMIGEANISWYDLGDRTLFMLTDSKSNTSLLYHLPVQNRERGEATSIFNPCPGHGNTYQTYIWTLSKKRLINIYAQRNLEQNK